MHTPVKYVVTKSPPPRKTMHYYRTARLKPIFLMLLNIEHGQNKVLDEKLELDNIIVAKSVLEKFTEARGARVKKVGFKLLGIGFIFECVMSVFIYPKESPL